MLPLHHPPDLRLVSTPRSLRPLCIAACLCCAALALPTQRYVTQACFPEAVKALRSGLVAATLAVYTAASTTLLPTPDKSHYLFNLRDVSRVVSGITLMPPAALPAGDGPAARDAALRLWVHEALRVFYDRCVPRWFSDVAGAKPLLAIHWSHLWLQ